MKPSEEIKNIYFTMRGRDADNAETMFAAILHYLDKSAEKPKEVMFTKEQNLAAKNWWILNHDDSKYKDNYFVWLDEHTEA